MRIITISGERYGQAAELAAALSKKLGCPVMERGELVELARENGIKVGRMEVAILKPQGPMEKLAREKELYLAFVTKLLCERAQQGDFIYCGGAGHLLLPGVSHKLRVGVTSSHERRIQRASTALKISSERATRYLERLDEDISRLQRFIHHVDGRNAGHFDVVLNMETMSVSNAATLLCHTAELPDFQHTPASLRQLGDHLLAARAKLLLAQDGRTREIDLSVHARDGELTVAYPPTGTGHRDRLLEVLKDLEGCRKLSCVPADSTILWVQERFDVESQDFEDVSQLAQRWGAVVEPLRLIPSDLGGGAPEPGAVREEDGPCYDGGVKEDDPADTINDCGLSRAEERLRQFGQSAGQTTIRGGEEEIMSRIQGQYALVILGNLFLAKGGASRKRLTRELAMAIRDGLKAPVVMVEELRSRWLFGKAQAFQLVGFGALVTFIYLAVFSHQEPILSFLGGPLHGDNALLSALAVGLLVPLIAFLYGTVAGLFLKLLNFD